MSKLDEVNAVNFEEKVLQSDKLIVVKFTALWCAPCLKMEPTLEKAAEELEGKGSILKIDIDDNPEIASRFGVRSIPTLILFQGGKETARLVGGHTKQEVLDLFEVKEV